MHRHLLTHSVGLLILGELVIVQFLSDLSLLQVLPRYLMYASRPPYQVAYIKILGLRVLLWKQQG